MIVSSPVQDLLKLVGRQQALLVEESASLGDVPPVHWIAGFIRAVKEKRARGGMLQHPLGTRKPCVGKAQVKKDMPQPTESDLVIHSDRSQAGAHMPARPSLPPLRWLSSGHGLPPGLPCTCRRHARWYAHCLF